MTSIIQKSPRLANGRAHASSTGGRLEVAREDINFFDVAPGVVRIEVTIRNVGIMPTLPTHADVSAAPLGAFVPWRPLTTLRVPRLEPGESTVLTAEAARSMTSPLGPPDRVPPDRVLTALDEGDHRPDPHPSPVLALANRGVSSVAPRPSLPTDIFDLFRRGNPHFAGNLNIFVGGVDVERHLARALRIYPGRTNIAMFVVGGRRDSYAFDLRGHGPGWETGLFVMSGRNAPAFDLSSGTPIDKGNWVHVDGSAMLMLTLVPPADCAPENVEVHVVQRSTAKSAIVEFGFDPDAAGPGCYVVT